MKICERSIDARKPSGETLELSVQLYLPQPDDDPDGDWSCRLAILGLDKEIEGRIHGVDSFQALLNSIKVIDAHLKRIERGQGLRLTWLGMDDLGFNLNIPG